MLKGNSDSNSHGNSNGTDTGNGDGNGNGNGQPNGQQAEKQHLRAKLPNSRRRAEEPKTTEAGRPYGRMQEAETPLGKWYFWLRQK